MNEPDDGNANDQDAQQRQDGSGMRRCSHHRPINMPHTLIKELGQITNHSIGSHKHRKANDQQEKQHRHATDGCYHQNSLDQASYQRYKAFACLMKNRTRFVGLHITVHLLKTIGHSLTDVLHIDLHPFHRELLGSRIGFGNDNPCDYVKKNDAQSSVGNERDSQDNQDDTQDGNIPIKVGGNARAYTTNDLVIRVTEETFRGLLFLIILISVLCCVIFRKLFGLAHLCDDFFDIGQGNDLFLFA